MPIVSIITPTYNHSKYIRECIESVLSQSFSEWEMIIIDDASSDETPKIVEEYAKTEKRIKFIRHEFNYGPQNLGKTYNEGLSLADGEFIAILEGDDYWPDYKLERQIKSFKDNSILSHGLYVIVKDFKNSKGTIIANYDHWTDDIKYNRPVGSALKAFLICEFPVASQTVLIRKDILMKIGGFIQVPPPAPFVDFETFMELSLYGEFDFHSEVLGYWRMHEESISSTYFEIGDIGLIESTKRFIDRNRDFLVSNIELHKYVKNSCFYACLSLCNVKLFKGELKEARFFLKEIIKRKEFLRHHFSRRKLGWIRFAFMVLGSFIPKIYPLSIKLYAKIKCKAV